MVYYLFWTAYSTRVNSKDFEVFFNTPLKKSIRPRALACLKAGLCHRGERRIPVTLKGSFYYHYYENFLYTFLVSIKCGDSAQEAFS